MRILTINDMKGLSGESCYLRADTTDFNVMAIVTRNDPDWNIQILRNRSAYLIVLATGADEKIHPLIRTGRFDLKRCVESADGIDYLLENMGMDESLNSLKKIPDEDEILHFHGMERTQKGRLPDGINMRALYKDAGVNVDARYCFHRVFFACDQNTFIPFDEHSELVTRIEEGHPWWSYCTEKLESSEYPFRCVIVQNDKLIAEANAGYTQFDEAGPINNNIFVVSVWVRYGYRGKGYGKAVASAVTKEIVNNGGVVDWATRIDNVASIATAKSLGYQMIKYHIGISKSPIGYWWL